MNIGVILALAGAALAVAAAGQKKGSKAATPGDELQDVVEQVDRHAQGASVKPAPASKQAPAVKPAPASKQAPASKPAPPAKKSEPGSPGNPLVLPAMVVNVDGYDPKKAKASAKQMAEHLRAKKYNYSRSSLAMWQAFAGVANDGKFGPNTEGALRYFGANPPRAFFNPRKLAPYYKPAGQ